MADNKVPWWLIAIPLIGAAGYAIYRIVRGGGGTGNAILTIIAGAGGITDPEAGTYEYAAGEQVSVYATPNAGYRFSHWSGDIGDSNPPLTPISVLMTGNKTITANFELITSAVKVNITIQATPGGHTDPPEGTYEFDEGSVMNAPSGLLAIPDDGYEFQEWAGHLNCPGGGLQNPIICVVRATDEGEIITAIFAASGNRGIQLNAGWNEGLTYGGSGPLALQIAMSGIWPYVQRVWCLQGGVWKMYDPTDPAGSNLTTLYAGDALGILMAQAYFWVWV